MPKPEIRNPGIAIKRRKNEEFRHLSQRRNSVLVFFIIRCKDRKFFPLVQIFWLKSLLFHFFILPLHRIFPKRCNPANCPDGGIGRRVGLKHQCRKASRFDPGSGYLSKQFKILQIANNKAFAGFFHSLKPSICSTFAPQVKTFPFSFCIHDLIYNFVFCTRFFFIS